MVTKEDTRPKYYENRVNAGLHVISPIVLDMMLQRTGLDVDAIGTIAPDVKH